MIHKKYKFHPELLEYKEIKPSRKSIIKKVVFYFFLSLVLSTGYFFIFLNISETPKEKALKKENSELKEIYKELNNKLTKINYQFKLIENRDKLIYRSIFNIAPFELRNGGTGGSNHNNQYNHISNKQLVLESSKKIEDLTRKLKIEDKSLKELEKMAFRKQKELLHTPAIQPVENNDLQRTGSGFGMRYHPILHIYRPHEGQDFVCPKGSEVYATAHGTVSSVRRSTTFGRVIEINHGYGFLSLYGHLSAFNVKKAQKVKRGDVIGYVGSTGLSSGNHLHYEVHKNGKAINPIPYFCNDLSPDEFVKMQTIADSIKQSMD